MGLEEVQEGKEACQILVEQGERTITWCTSKDGKEFIYITRRKMTRAGNWDKLKDHSGKNVEHRAERCIHKRGDWTTTLVLLLAFGKNIAGRELTAFANCPRLRPAVITIQLGDERVKEGGWRFLDAGKKRVSERFVHGLIIQTWAKDS